MANVVICPGCEHQLRVKPELLGKRIKCPSCKSAFTAKEEMQTKAPRRVGQPVENKESKPTFKDKLLEGSSAMISGLALIGVGVGLFFIYPSRISVVVFVVGMVILCYGIMGGNTNDI